MLILSDIIPIAIKEDLWIFYPDENDIPSYNLDDTIFINYFISAAYKGANKIELYKKYIKIANDQMVELSNRMDIEHRQLFMDKWINKQIVAQKNNI